MSDLKQKRGVGTTEFWITMGTLLGGATAFGMSEDTWVKIASIVGPILTNLLYTWSRTKVKG